MITVLEFNKICKDIVESIGIKGYVLCSTEEQGMKKLKDKSGIQLVAVYPNYSFSGQEDSYKDLHEILFYMVTRQVEGTSDDKELGQYADTQAAIMELKQYLFGEGDHDTGYCRLFPEGDISTVNIIPEYNVFGGYLGWSMVIEL